MKTSKIISVGFAMFAMLFGAGNVVFPLVLGRNVGNKFLFGLLGFCIIAVVLPLIGLVATMLCDGEYKNILGKLGRIPGALIALICLIVIGPFAIAPRCITLSHAAIKMYMPQFTLFYFSIFACVLIYLCTIKKGAVVDLLGRFLGPLKLVLLCGIIVKGLFVKPDFLLVVLSDWEVFYQGLMQGAGTADLLATIFFSGLILTGLKKGVTGPLDYKKLALMGLQAGAVGAFLLGLVYAGFCMVAAFHGQQIALVADSDIFSVLARLILGGAGGLLANLTVAISCLTTAIALTTVFATYLSSELFPDKLNYRNALIVTVLITTVMSNLGFAGIVKIMMPIVMALYPALLILCLVSSAQVLFGFKWIKTPFFVTLAGTLVMQYWSTLQNLFV